MVLNDSTACFRLANAGPQTLLEAKFDIRRSWFDELRFAGMPTGSFFLGCSQPAFLEKQVKQGFGESVTVGEKQLNSVQYMKQTLYRRL